MHLKEGSFLQIKIAKISLPIKYLEFSIQCWLPSYKACNRFLLRRYCHSQFARDIAAVAFSSDRHRLMWILRHYRAFRSSWEVSSHEPSRMVALFMKSMRSYVRCKQAISNQDGWLLEIESCYWLPVWKMLNKTTYLHLQCEYMEDVLQR